jgi:hypothetical protein
LADAERTRILSGRVDALLAEAAQLDFSVDEVVGLVQERSAHWTARRGEGSDHE